MLELPEDFELSALRRRQVESVRRRGLVVEPGLERALAGLEEPIAYLDFETTNPAIPLWRGCAPFDPVAVQWSCHVRAGRSVNHHEHLAESGQDPREPLVLALLEATRTSATVLAYNASFETSRIDDLARALPRHAKPLRALAGRVQDLLPIVRDHVYHPDFRGSFSIKQVLPVLVPGLGYDGLEVRDGQTASALLEQYLASPEPIPRARLAKLRRALLAYCKQDTFAMVKLHERLKALAGSRA